jgi:transcriptional regulator with XRE-family HTH domain/tetratricopeptide (TPR) repeat protein
VTAAEGDLSVTFGTLLRHHRVAARLTQEELAEAANLAVRTVRNLERDTVAPRRTTADELADALALEGASRTNFLQHARPRAAPATISALPPDLPDFIGCQQQLAQLRTAMERAQRADGQQSVVVVVSGPPGVGKTTLATHAAHRCWRPRAGSTASLVDLRGTTSAPLSVADALAVLLTAMGVTNIPAELPARLTLYRSLTGDRSGVLILDDAADESLVRPLLPTGAGWCTLITSRHVHAGLDGVVRLPLQPPEVPEAVAFLAAVLGAGRVAEEPAAVHELVALCGRLPLALRVAGNRLATRPAWSVASYVEQLRDEQRRLDLLAVGDVGVRAAVMVSYRQLTVPAQVLLRRLALLPWPDLPARVATALADPAAPAGVAAPADPLAALADVGLLIPALEPDRYLMHSLIRLFAAERAEAEETPPAIAAALDRVAEQMLDGVVRYGRQLEPHPDELADPDLDPEAAFTPSSDPATLRRALRWLTVERESWWWAVRRAAAAGRHHRVIAAARALHWYSDRHLHAVPWADLFELAVTAARATGDRREEAVQRNAFGWALSMVCARSAQAREQHRRAEEIFEAESDRLNVAWSVLYSGTAASRAGDPLAAADRYAHAAALFGQAAQPANAMLARSALGSAYREAGDLDAATATHRALLEELEAGGMAADPHLAGTVRYHLGRTMLAAGHSHDASALLDRALADLERAGVAARALDARVALGEALTEAGEAERAVAVLHRAAADARTAGDPLREAQIRHLLGAAGEVTEGDTGPRPAADLTPGATHR